MISPVLATAAHTAMGHGLVGHMDGHILAHWLDDAHHFTIGNNHLVDLVLDGSHHGVHHSMRIVVREGSLVFGFAIEVFTDRVDRAGRGTEYEFDRGHVGRYIHCGGLAMVVSGGHVEIVDFVFGQNRCWNVLAIAAMVSVIVVVVRIVSSPMPIVVIIARGQSGNGHQSQKYRDELTKEQERLTQLMLDGNVHGQRTRNLDIWLECFDDGAHLPDDRHECVYILSINWVSGHTHTLKPGQPKKTFFLVISMKTSNQKFIRPLPG